MNKIAIWSIIILMSAGVVGSFFIQLYWINFSLELNESKFDQNVFSALSNVASQLERIDQVRQSTEILNLYGKTVNVDWDEVAKNPYSTQDYSVTINVLERLLKIDSASILDPTHLLTGGIWSSMVDGTIVETVALEERIDPLILDQLIETELNNRNIGIKFHYGVYSNEEEAFVIDDGKYTVPFSGRNISEADVEQVILSSLSNSRYKVKLFASHVGSPGSLIIHFPDRSRFLWEDTWVTLLGSVLFTILILFCFGYTIFIIFRQKQLSEMKSDFINNMTHEFKTPIATISLAADSIFSPRIFNNPDKVKRFAGVIKQENQRMLGQVEKVLQMALIDKKQFGLKITDLDLHEIIEQSVGHFSLLVQKREGGITTSLNARNPVIRGDRVHIENIINNLMDNAYKYSPEKPEIKIRTFDTNDGIEVWVSDNGVGLTSEAKMNIFDKFYRVHTGNLHDVKGFGLGLTYVKAMMIAHGGVIDVESTPGRGSTFILNFPRNFEKD
ncbi:MAG: sensor histidine kinase [Saprospirales bacterium]|nr:MAG: sensor histidine kinase [Saprospirales bacterium]